MDRRRNQSGDHFELQSSMMVNNLPQFKLYQLHQLPEQFHIDYVAASASAAYYRLVLVNRNSMVSMSKVILLDSNNPVAESLQVLQKPCFSFDSIQL
jgi:hypothetical protein